MQRMLTTIYNPSFPRDVGISLPSDPKSLQHLRTHKIDHRRSPRHAFPVPTAHSLSSDGLVPCGREPYARGGALRNIRCQSRSRAHKSERKIYPQGFQSRMSRGTREAGREGVRDAFIFPSAHFGRRLLSALQELRKNDLYGFGLSINSNGVRSSLRLSGSVGGVETTF